jgi:hypothetical protein
VNLDENVDLYDFPQYDLDQYNSEYGYYRAVSDIGSVINTDWNGDGNVDLYDFPIFDLNSYNTVYSVHP